MGSGRLPASPGKRPHRRDGFGGTAGAPVDCGRARPGPRPAQQATQWQARRRQADRRRRPPRPGTAGCLRRLRSVGARRGRRQADLLRPLRAAAPRPGVGRHRGQQRSPDPRLQGHGPGLAGVRRGHAGLAPGSPRGRARALLDHRREHLAQRPADVPAHRDRLDRAGAQRQPDQHPRARRQGRSAGRGLRRARHPGQGRPHGHQRHQPGHGAPRAPPRHEPGGERRPGPPRAPRRLLVRLDGREHPVRRPRRAGRPAAGPRPARARLGGRLRDRRPRHRRRVLHPRGRARRDGRHRRGRPAQPALRRARAQALPLRVRLPRPSRHPDERAPRAQRPRRDRPPAGAGVPRPTPTW